MDKTQMQQYLAPKKQTKNRVKVALRVRPMISRQSLTNQSSCIEYLPQQKSKIIIGKNRCFTFDNVFSQNSKQIDIYQKCIKQLVLGCFQGYNAAVLAYGQTGSGKTYTMGTGANQILNFNNFKEQQIYREQRRQNRNSEQYEKQKQKYINNNINQNNWQQVGIIPRVIMDIFNIIKLKQKVCKIIIKVSYIQIYNEQIIDLLSTINVNSMLQTTIQQKNINNNNNISHNNNNNNNTNNIGNINYLSQIQTQSYINPTIRQQKDGSISLINVIEQIVTTYQQMMKLLYKGGCNRSTSSTLMNDCSSRSHGIFAIHIQQHHINNNNNSNNGNMGNNGNNNSMGNIQQNDGFITAKFHFVDLAGSQRAKKTGASGITFRQGININLGLLQLGNVISALSSISQRKQKQSQFITYRNSKLTRILQDSLGGNSNTYMIACISPAQSNYQESLNTIKYATKAMNIKNTPIINRDPHTAQINALKDKINVLDAENRGLKRILEEHGIYYQINVNYNQNSNGIFRQSQQISNNMFMNNINVNGSGNRNDIRYQILSEQIKKMKNKVSQLELKNQVLQSQLKQNSKKKNKLQIANYQLKKDRDRYKLKMQKTTKNSNNFNTNNTNNNNNFTNTNNSMLLNYIQNPQMKTIVQQYLQNQQQYGLMEQYQSKIRQLQSQLFEQQKINDQLQIQHQKLSKQMKKDQNVILQKNKQILKLKNNIKILMNQSKIIKQRQSQSNIFSRSQPIQVNQPIMKDIYQQNINKNNNIESQQEQNDNLTQNQIQQNQQIKNAQFGYRLHSDARTQKLQLVQFQIREQQQKLQAMTEQQINLQYQLISEIKQQYHQKIVNLQKQKLALMKQQQQMAGYQKNPKLKQKIQSLQLQLREFRKKAKQQNILEKKVSLQSQQIKKLANQIKMHKVKKIQINRKIKQDKNAYDKFKKQKIKQIMAAKKQNVRKDKQIRKLALQNKKKSLQMNKKNEQLDKAKRINQAMKSYNKNTKKHNKNISLSHQQKTRKPKQNTNIQQQSIQNEIILLIHRKSLQFILQQQQIKIQMQKYDKKILQLQQQIQKVLDQQAFIQLKIDKLDIHESYELLNNKNNNYKQNNTQYTQLLTKLQQLKQRIPLIQQNIVYYQGRYNQLSRSLPQFYQQADVINNQNLNTIQKFQTIIKYIYLQLRTYISNNIINFRNTEQLNAQNGQLKQQIQKIRQQLANNVSQHQINLARLRQEMMTKYYSNLQEQIGREQIFGVGNINNNVNNSSNVLQNNRTSIQRIDERERKVYQRKLMDLNKTNRQLSADVEMWRRKCSIVQQKYHNINIKMAKDKFIGIGRAKQKQQQQRKGNKKNSNGWNIGGINSVNSINNNINNNNTNNNNPTQMLEQVKQMIDKIQNKKRGNINYINNEQQQILQQKNESTLFTKNKWQCIMQLKASRSPILSMSTYNNLLITSGTKCINIWDKQNCQLIADLSNVNYLQNFVKSVIIIPQMNYFAAACQKFVYIWDLRTYQTVAVLKGHKDQVRCLYTTVGINKSMYNNNNINNNLFFSAGKGSPTTPSLLIWDIRKLQFPLQQKQKNIDIFAMTSYENILYHGTRNHQVRRLSLISQTFSQNSNYMNNMNNNMNTNINININMNNNINRQILPPLQPPHMDTVTSLAVLNGYLISGSKDKNLRLWSLDNNNLNTTTNNNTNYNININNPNTNIFNTNNINNNTNNNNNIINNDIQNRNIRQPTHAFNDYINTIQSNKQLGIFYVGSRDGQIKIATIFQDKIKFIGGTIAHTQSVNVICNNNYQFNNNNNIGNSNNNNNGIFLTGSADKTVKFWKPDSQTYDRLCGVYQEY